MADDRNIQPDLLFLGRLQELAQKYRKTGSVNQKQDIFSASLNVVSDFMREVEFDDIVFRDAIREMLDIRRGKLPYLFAHTKATHGPGDSIHKALLVGTVAACIDCLLETTSSLDAAASEVAKEMQKFQFNRRYTGRQIQRWRERCLTGLKSEPAVSYYREISNKLSESLIEPIETVRSMLSTVSKIAPRNLEEPPSETG